MLEERISKALNISSAGVKAVINLYDADATIPFIARYRKEMTGGLDEVQIGDIVDTYESLKNLIKRREAILKSMTEQGVLTSELKTQIDKYEEPLYHIIRTPNSFMSDIVIENFKEFINEDIEYHVYDKDCDIDDINNILKSL